MQSSSNVQQSAVFAGPTQEEGAAVFPPAVEAAMPTRTTKADHPRTGSSDGTPDRANIHTGASNLTSIKPARRRDKPQLSCNPCRNRKSRCDRRQPCTNCASRGQNCSYAPGQNPAGLPPVPSLMSGTLGVHDRLVQLERLVKSLIPTTAPERPLAVSTPPLDSSRPSIAEAPEDGTISDSGSICAGASDLHYVVGEHWTALLNNIAELKEHFDREEQLKLVEDPRKTQMEPDSSPRPPGRALLLYPTQRSSRAEVLAALPPKDAVDRYLSYYFNHLDMASCKWREWNWAF